MRVFDPYRGPLVNLVRRRYLAARRAPRRAPRGARDPRDAEARRARARARAADPPARRRHPRRRGPDRRRVPRERRRHPPRGHPPSAPAGRDRRGLPAAQLRRLGERPRGGAIAAGVGTFVFASSAQVYRINSPVRVDELPLPESARTCRSRPRARPRTASSRARSSATWPGAVDSGAIQGVALRLEYPGFRSTVPQNLYVSTSIENTIAGFACALRPPADLRFGAFNLADATGRPGRSSTSRTTSRGAGPTRATARWATPAC